jgi:ABC-type transport system involved in multi-copper enzyme maturation permease subunit
VSPRLSSLFGPLVRWELVRLARQGQTARSRVLLVYSLLLALIVFAVVWSFWRNPTDPAALLRGGTEALSHETLAGLAEWLALTLLEVQLLVVAAITPAYAAAAVSEEKDRRTLSLLLTTQLTDREIVWGKGVARVLFVLAAVASGIPVLMFTLLLGGVDVGFLAAGYALTAGTAVLSAAIGVSAACHAPDSRTALVRAYGQTAVLVGGVLVPPFVMLSPFAMLLYYQVGQGDAAWQVACGFGYPVGQAVIAWVLMIEATRGLRRPGPTAGPPTPTEYPEPPRGRATPVVLGPRDADPPPLPPLDAADPVLWKERHSGRVPPVPVLDRPLRILGAVVTVVAVALFVGGGWLVLQRAMRALDPAEAARYARSDSAARETGSRLLVAAGVLASGLYLLPLAVGVTGCVASERFRGTLDSLLTTTLGRKKMLRSKARAHAERGLVFAGGAAAALGAGFGVDGGTRFGLAALAAFAAGVGLVVGLGAWLSVRCATPVRAFRMCLPAVVAVVGLPVIAANLKGLENAPDPMGVLAWSAAAFAVAGAVCWWRAGVELERGGN